jgi:hypothetical protein
MEVEGQEMRPGASGKAQEALGALADPQSDP